MSKKKKSSFESQLKRIQEITEKMQHEEISLEESLKLFEEGTQLIRQCQSFLDESELKVKQIIDNNLPQNMKDFEEEA